MLLLHGTGGDGDSLLQLGGTLLPGAALLSPTGNVREGGAPRFFRRLAEGVFDLEDLSLRTAELARFVREAVDAYGLDPERIIAAGYSNGANIAASLLLTDPSVLRGAVLFRAMLPFEPERLPSARGVRVLVARGERDRITPAASTARLVELLEETGAEVSVHVEPAGHELAMGDIVAATEWLTRVG